ncbi:MAG: hypothetical protein ACLP50_29435 [Solirubrobacteraceae bacterium]
MPSITLQPGDLRPFYTAVSRTTGTGHTLGLRTIDCDPTIVDELADILTSGEPSHR